MHAWKGKGLVEYIDSEDEDDCFQNYNHNDGVDISTSNEEDNDWEDEIETNPVEDDNGSEGVQGNSDQDEGGIPRFSELTHLDIMGMEFKTLDEGESFYLAYAKEIGFSVRKRSLQKNVSGMPCVRVLVCQKQGSRDKKWISLPGRQRAPKPDVRENCAAQMRLRYDKSRDLWVVTKFVMEHTHALVASKHVHFLRSHRKMDEAVKAEIRALVHGGLGSRAIIDLLGKHSGGYDRMGFTKKDVYNYLNGLNGLDCIDGDVRGVAEFFQSKQNVDKGFYFNKSVCEENRLGNLFWADSTCRFDYSCFGAVISFDSAFKRNRYDRPLVLTTGVNHHHQTIVFCCAILVDSTTNSYSWMLSELLKCMGGKKPNAVVTDGEQSMARAIRDIVPEAVHRLCSFHIQQTLHRRFHNQDALIGDFSTLMWKRMEASEFEIGWLKMVAKYSLHENEWLKNMYESRHMWAEAFLKGHFFACTRTTPRCEALHSYMDKYVKRRLCFHMFMQQFDTVLMRIREEESYLDHRDRLKFT